MKSIRPMVLLVVVATAMARAAEVPNGGWTTDFHQILQMYSVWSYTVVKINDATGCGGSGDGDWLLATTTNDVTLDKALALKKSMLLMAMASGKLVRLRCENSRITDMIVKN